MLVCMHVHTYVCTYVCVYVRTYVLMCDSVVLSTLSEYVVFIKIIIYTGKCQFVCQYYDCNIYRT